MGERRLLVGSTLLCILSLVFSIVGTAGPAFAVPTFLDGISDSMYYDADKYWVKNGTGPDPSDASCWQAAASNMLAYTEWGSYNTNVGSNDEEQIYDYLLGKYTKTQDGNSNEAWEFWFSEPGLESHSFSDYYIGDHHPSILDFKETDSIIRNSIDNGYGSVLSLSKQDSGNNIWGHAISLWGYEVIDENSMKVWVSDSDRNRDSLDEYMMYLGKSISLDHYWDAWYIDYGGDITQHVDSWYATGMQTLGSSAPVPEPATLLLFGTGILGMGLRRKIFRRK